MSSTRIRDIVTQQDARNLGLVLKDNAQAVSVDCMCNLLVYCDCQICVELINWLAILVQFVVFQ